jgi:ubiquinone/menaquinone biosynthesis C-methylase UbiE
VACLSIPNYHGPVSASGSWLFDETDHAGAEHLDQQYVRDYDLKAGFDPSTELETLTDLGLGPDSTLVDVGAGTGEFALAASRVANRVIAVDVSIPMLGVIRSKAAEQRRTNLDIVQAGFRTYQHVGQAPNFVYTRNALHHLPDFWKAIALQRLVNLLPGGGILQLRDLVYSFGPADAKSHLTKWFASATDDSSRGWTSDELMTHVRTEHSTFSWLLETMLLKAGFTIENVSYSDSKVFAAYTCVKR